MGSKHSGRAYRFLVPIVIIVVLLIAWGTREHSLSQKHQSTISSLKSELSSKGQVIENKNILIQQKQAELDLQSSLLEQQQKKLDKRQAIIELNIKEAQVSDNKIEAQKKTINQLQKKLSSEQSNTSLKAKPTTVNATTVSAKASGSFQSGWTATYYSLSVASTGKRPGHPGYGITASGRKVVDGVTIAVDPRYIPLGTWIEIKMPNGEVIKRRADDTGSAIKGHKLDIYVAGVSDSYIYQELGKKQISIRILGKGELN
jgi:3D (Asp-Asp-Asp) domain-containing protein